VGQTAELEKWLEPEADGISESRAAWVPLGFALPKFVLKRPNV
jgi:hypothetical protein